MRQEVNAMMDSTTLTGKAAMHIAFDMPCLLICQENPLGMNCTEYNVSESSL